MCPGERDLAGVAMYADLERVKLWLSRGSHFSRFVKNLCHSGAQKTHGEERPFQICFLRVRLENWSVNHSSVGSKRP